MTAKRILIVKLTSLGDVIETQPVVADLHRAFPGVKIDWVADTLFADIIRWNSGVDRVLCAPLREFKKARRWSDLRAIVASIATLRSKKYNLVIDLHGVYKSAIISFLARSRQRFGYTLADLGERGAAFAYSHRFARPSNVNAWHGMRVAVSQALDYPLDGPAQFNLQVPRPATSSHGSQASGGAPYALLFHATSNEAKKWRSDYWIALGRELSACGLRILLPWGSDRERTEARAIAASMPGAQVLPRLTITECAQFIEAAALVVGTDTGLVHLAHALQKPTVMIFTTSSRSHFGIDAPGRTTSVGEEGAAPTVNEVLAAIESVCPHLLAAV